MKNKISRRLLNHDGENIAEWTFADKMIAKLSGQEVDFNSEEHAKTKRCNIIFNHLMNGLTRREIVTWFKEHDDYSSLHHSTFYRDIIDTQKIYGKIHQLDKLFEQSFLAEQSRKNIKRAIGTNDIEKINKAIQTHYLVCGLDKDGVDAIDFTELAKSVIVNLNVDMKVLQVIQEQSASGALNLDSLLPKK